MWTQRTKCQCRRSGEARVGLFVPADAVEFAQLPKHCGLHHRHGNGACHRKCIAGARRKRKAQNMGVGFAHGAVALRWRKLGERDRHSGWCCFLEGGNQRLAAVVGRIEPVARSREIDGYEAQRTAAGEGLEQGALVLENTGEAARNGGGRWCRSERIGQ